MMERTFHRLTRQIWMIKEYVDDFIDFNVLGASQAEVAANTIRGHCVSTGGDSAISRTAILEDGADHTRVAHGGTCKGIDIMGA
jgi:hypothetical protein